jgi:hypothetical protein
MCIDATGDAVVHVVLAIRSFVLDRSSDETGDHQNREQG